MRPANETAKLISRALISASNRSFPTRSWSASLEQTLHQLGCRDSLNPSLVARVIDPFLLDRHSLAHGFFNWASQQPGYCHTSLTYQSLLKSLSLSRQLNSVEKLLKQIKTQKIVLDSSAYQSIIASQILGKKTQTAFSIFNEIREMGIRVGPEICNSLLAALASDGCICSAQRVFDEMRVRGACFNTVGFGVFIGRFCRGEELGKTLGLLEEVKSRGGSVINGSVVALLIVDGLCRASRVSEASIALEELRRRECKPDFMAYRVVAEAFRLSGLSVESEKVLKRKRKLGVAPRTNDYREFLFVLVSERLIHEAKELGEIIISGNFPIEDDILNVLIGSVSFVDCDSAYLFCKSMIEKERLPTLLTLSNLCRNLCKSSKIEEMLVIFSTLSSRDYFVSSKSYNVMISFLCEAGRVKEAYEAIGEMRKKGFGPDVSSYNSLMEACCREDLLRPAKRLWDEMFANGCCGNLKTYNTLIGKLSQTGEVEEACRLFYHMLEKGVVPDSATYTFLLEGLCREAKVEVACKVFEKSVEQDTVVAQTVLTTLVRSLCKEGHYLAASKVIRGLTPNIEKHDCHVVLLKCLADVGEMDMALGHVAWISHYSPFILQAISAELVAFVSSSLKPEPIAKLLCMLKEKGLTPRHGTQMDLFDLSGFDGSKCRFFMSFSQEARKFSAIQQGCSDDKGDFFADD